MHGPKVTDLRFALLEAFLACSLLACSGGGSVYIPGPPVEAPGIAVQPRGATLTEPAALALSVTATGAAPLSYQWKKDGTSLPGATSPTFGVALTAPEDSGNYTVEVHNSTLQKAVSTPAVVLVQAATGPPQIIVQPQSLTVTAPAMVTLSVRAIGTRPFTYQWLKNGTPITGATGATCSFQAALPADGGSFTVSVSNGISPDALSQAAQVAVNSSPYSGTFQDLPSLSFARSQHTATLLPSGRVLVSGGTGTAGTPLDRAETFDPSQGSFSTLPASMKSPRSAHTATLLANGMVLLAGGQGPAGTLASAEIFDPASGTFTLLAATMSSPRANHSATLLGSGKVLLAGGQGPFGTLASAELYDPVTKTFLATGSLAAPRSQHTATLLANGQVLLAGGLGIAGALDQAEVFDTAVLPSGSFTPLGSALSAGRSGHAALLVGAKVLLAGGMGNFGPLTSADLFDPSQTTFSPTGSLVTARTYATASLLTDGRILIVGGLGTAGYLDSAELFSPSAGTFTPSGSSLSAARSGHSATVLPSGKVLIAGGAGNSGPLNSACQYR